MDLSLEKVESWQTEIEKLIKLDLKDQEKALTSLAEKLHPIFERFFYLLGKLETSLQPNFRTLLLAPAFRNTFEKNIALMLYFQACANSHVCSILTMYKQLLLFSLDSEGKKEGEQVDELFVTQTLLALSQFLSGLSKSAHDDTSYILSGVINLYETEEEMKRLLQKAAAIMNARSSSCANQLAHENESVPAAGKSLYSGHELCIKCLEKEKSEIN